MTPALFWCIVAGAFGAGAAIGAAASASRAYRHGFEDGLEAAELDGYPCAVPVYNGAGHSQP